MTGKEIEKVFKKAAKLQAQLNAIYEANPEIAALEAQIEDLKKELRAYAIENGDMEYDYGTVKVSTRTSWDSKGLAGYAKARPEVLEFRSESAVATVKFAK